MSKETSSAPYKGFRFPIEISNHCVWLYARFSLSYRDVELLMTEAELANWGESCLSSASFKLS